MGGPAPPPGAPDQLQNFFPRRFDFERLNVTTKKGRQISFFGGGRRGEKSAHLEKHPPGENPGYAYKKRAPPYVGMGSSNG